MLRQVHSLEMGGRPRYFFAESSNYMRGIRSRDTSLLKQGLSIAAYDDDSTPRQQTAEDRVEVMEQLVRRGRQ